MSVIVLFFFIFKVPYKNMNYVYFGAIQMRKYCLERSIHWRKYSLRKYSLARMYKILPEVSDIWLCTHCLFFEMFIYLAVLDFSCGTPDLCWVLQDLSMGLQLWPESSVVAVHRLSSPAACETLVH